MQNGEPGGTSSFEEADQAASHVSGKPPRPTWATVIGTISIVLGVLGVLPCLPWIALAVTAKAFPTAWVAHVGGAWVVVQFLVSALLLVAGIGLIRQRGTALLHIPVGVLSLMVTAKVVMDRVDILNTVQMTIGRMSTPGTASEPYSLTGVLVALIVLAGSVQGVYPAFVIFWFLRPSIRRQVLSWRPQSGEAPSAPEEIPTWESQISVERPPAPRTLPRARPSAWPTYIGLTSLGMAVLSVLPGSIAEGQGGYFNDRVCFTWPLAGLLVIAGTGLIRRRASAMLHLLYAGAKLFFVLAVVLPGGIGGATPPGLVRLAVQSAFAVFLLIWFSRTRVRLEAESWDVVEEAPSDA